VEEVEIKLRSLYERCVDEKGGTLEDTGLTPYLDAGEEHVWGRDQNGGLTWQRHSASVLLWRLYWRIIVGHNGLR
jgi:hypothetical protein